MHICCCCCCCCCCCWCRTRSCGLIRFADSRRPCFTPVIWNLFARGPPCLLRGPRRQLQQQKQQHLMVQQQQQQLQHMRQQQQHQRERQSPFVMARHVLMLWPTDCSWNLCCSKREKNGLQQQQRCSSCSRCTYSSNISAALNQKWRHFIKQRLRPSIPSSVSVSFTLGVFVLLLLQLSRTQQTARKKQQQQLLLLLAVAAAARGV